jgi:hypothetical protein
MSNIIGSFIELLILIGFVAATLIVIQRIPPYDGVERLFRFFGPIIVLTGIIFLVNAYFIPRTGMGLVPRGTSMKPAGGILPGIAAVGTGFAMVAAAEWINEQVAWLDHKITSIFRRPWRRVPEKDPLTQLERIARLRQEGVLSEAEFQTEKQRILSSHAAR